PFGCGLRQIKIGAGAKQIVSPAKVCFGVDDNNRQPRIFSFELLEQTSRRVVRRQLEKGDEETVRPKKIGHRVAHIFERSELRDLHAFFRERALRRDAHERIALEEDDISELRFRSLDLEETAGDFELSC